MSFDYCFSQSQLRIAYFHVNGRGAEDISDYTAIGRSYHPSLLSVQGRRSGFVIGGGGQKIIWYYTFISKGYDFVH